MLTTATGLNFLCVKTVYKGRDTRNLCRFGRKLTSGAHLAWKPLIFEIIFKAKTHFLLNKKKTSQQHQKKPCNSFLKSKSAGESGGVLGFHRKLTVFEKTSSRHTLSNSLSITWVWVWVRVGVRVCECAWVCVSVRVRVSVSVSVWTCVCERVRVSVCVGVCEWVSVSECEWVWVCVSECEWV